MKIVEKLTESKGLKVRNWTFRDDNQRHYHGKVSEYPFVVVSLIWKNDKKTRSHPVGVYRFNLKALETKGCVKWEKPQHVRLRIQRTGMSLEVSPGRKSENVHAFDTISTLPGRNK